MTRLVLLLIAGVLAAGAQADTVACRSADYQVRSVTTGGPPIFDVYAQRCQGGSNAGAPCDSNTNCPSSTCAAAVGNGVADDTTALQATINAAQAVPNSTVNLGCGSFKITSGLQIASRVGGTPPFSIEGRNRTCAQIITASDITMLNVGTWTLTVPTDGLFQTPYSQWSRVGNMSIRHVTFINTNNPGANSVGIDLHLVFDSDFEDINISTSVVGSLMTGIRVNQTSNTNYFRRISASYVGNAIVINGQVPSSCPGATGLGCANYNATLNEYVDIMAYSPTKSIILATGGAFGDLSIHNVNGFGGNNSYPAIWMHGAPGQLYANQISISGVMAEGFISGLTCDYCGNFAFIGNTIYDYAGGAPLVVNGGSNGGPTYIASYTTPTGGAVNVP